MPAAPASGYHVVDLGTLPGGGYSTATAVNDRGHVVGSSNDHAVLWRDGRVIDLGVLPGMGSSIATDLNERDEVVGWSIHADGQSIRPFLWRNGRMRDLGALPGGGPYSYAYGINDAGDIVGRSSYRPDEFELTHAVRWHAGRITDMDPGGVNSSAYDITNGGWIVGTRATPRDPGSDVAVAWRNDRPTVLFPGLAGSYATAANERRQAVGFQQYSYLWSRGVVTPLAIPEGSGGTRAAGINNRGQIVGASDDKAVLWQRGRRPGGLVVLPDLRGGSSVATGINDRGRIVGTSTSTPDGTVPHAVFWTR